MRIRYYILLIAANFFFSAALNAQACECTNCPQFMPDLFVGDFNINIQGATNPTLGQNGQGVCGVVVHFDHTAICDITITLTAPSGQTITLVGPIGQFCTSNGNAGTDWNVTFVPCGSGAMPDPGFAAQWDNNQNWGGGNSYSGSYYPFNGCLQNLSGPVNGNWTLTVTDGQANDVGNLYDYEIIFCDPSGINCVSCVADAGILPQPDVMACAGTPELSLDLPPSYPPPSIQPPASDYSYSYVISGLGGVIQSISAAADLSAAPPGNYTVCGLSYLSAHQSLIPMPNGTLTLTQLTNQLNSNTPPFCGNISSNCVNVTVFPLSPDTEETVSVCQPECYEFLGQFYCQTGDYIVDQVDANGCHYNAILHLTVNAPTFKTITETICPGTCSSNTTLFPGACSTGTYQATLTNAAGCDSIVTLNLTVMAVDAVIQPPGMISCSQTTVPLSGVGSTFGGGVTYLWSASNGGTIVGPNNLINATAGAAGTYKLLLCRTIGGVTCCDSAMVNVSSSSSLPNTPLLMGNDTVCPQSTQVYFVNPVMGASSYTWTVSAGVNLLSGQGDTLITVQWNSAVNGDICVTADNSCGSSAPACMTIVPLDTAATPVLTGNPNVCRDSTYTYSADTIQGASAINWTVTGGTLLNGNGSYVVQVKWDSLQTAGTVCAVSINACDTSAITCLNVAINSVPDSAIISGDSLRCAGTIGTYAIDTLMGATGYSWTVPVGGNILSGQDSTVLTVQWTSAPGGNVCVRGMNACGNGPITCFPVTVFEVPTANAGPDAALCGLGTNLAASNSISGSSGLWTQLAGPGTASFGNNSLAATTVTVSTTGVYQFQWTETNGICSDADTVQISFNSSPAAGLPQRVCDGTNQNYTVTFPITGGTGPYSVSGGTVNNGVFSSNPIPSGQPYSFVITDANNCSSSPIIGTFNCNCSSDAGQMNTQTLMACSGSSVTAGAVIGVTFDADDIGAFVLHTGSGGVLGTVLDENTNGVFGFLPGMSFGTTYYISFVVGNNLNGSPDLTDPCLSVAPGQPAIFVSNPVANAGQDISTCGLSTMVTGNAAAGTTQTWSVLSTPSGGMATIANPQNAATNVTVNIFGSYSLLYTLNDNGCVGTDTIVLNYGSGPAAGAATHTCSPDNQQYSVSFSISGGQAPYTVNGQPVAGALFSSTAVNSGGAYNFVVTDANGCTSNSITGSFTCSCSTNAGTLSQTLLTICQSDSVSAQALIPPTLDANDVVAYYLHSGNGPALGTVYLQNTSGKFGYWATLSFGATYYISAVVGNNLNGFPDPNDPCYSVAQGQPVVFIQNPAPNAGGDFVVCGLTANLPADITTFSGNWSQVSGPGTAVFADPQNPKSMVTAPVVGTYVFRWSLTNGQCAAEDDVQAMFLSNPVVGPVTAICNGTNTGYTLSFSVSSGSGVYFPAGISGVFAGSNFTSVELPNNSNYSFSVKDAFGCQSAVVAGTHFCPCITDAGTMNSTPLVFCVDAPAITTWNNDATLDADDAVQFVLHDQPGTTLGTIFATNTLPEFSFGPGLQTGITYYISAIAGSSAAGNINQNDPCFSVAPGTPIRWKALPFAAIIGDATICNGSSTVLNINGLGDFPLSVLFDDGSGNPTPINIPNQQTIALSVLPTSTTIYTLTTVTDGTMPACSASLNSSVTVNVNQPVSAGMANTPVELCAGANQTIQLATLITAEDPGGTWSETSIQPSTQSAFNAAAGTFNINSQAAGTYTFRYFVQAALPCPSQSTTVTVVIHPTPVADAGLDQLIDCHQDSAVLGGPNSSVGSGIQYAWTRAGQAIDTSAQISTDQAGIYTLVVSNALGCSDTDTATITVDNDIPMAQDITITDVHCFGEDNGAIVLGNITSGHEPVLVSLNGGPFSEQSNFSNLEAGDYVITLQDSKGCEWESGVLSVVEPPLLSLDLGTQLTVSFGDAVLLEAQCSAPLTALQSIRWSPLLDTANANTFIQEFLPLNSWNIGLEVVDTAGCKASARVIVLVQRPQQVYIPNIFNTGSISFNDHLTVYGGRGVAEVESFRIFDRWGDQVFEAKGFAPNDLSVGWDGSYRGDKVLPGVYVYFAVVRYIDGATEVFKGDVTVLR